MRILPRACSRSRFVPLVPEVRGSMANRGLFADIVRTVCRRRPRWGAFVLRFAVVVPVGVAMLPPAPLLAAQGAPEPARTITVVVDDTYPPFIFRDGDGGLNGILPDLWALWSRKTGVGVDLRAMDWARAQRIMAEGGADVIDTLFRTPAREVVFDFSAPYATLDVSIFFHRDLSGVSDANTLRGFTVGVKEGDACIDWLSARGVETFKPYPSYEALIDAAARRDVVVFCIDEPPARYLLFKKNLQDQFRHSQPLYSGQFHWAVRKGNPDLHALVATGFARITPDERRAIEDRWFGMSLDRAPHLAALRDMLRYLLVAVAVGISLVVWNGLLRRQVAAKTADLTRALSALTQSETRFRTILDSVNDAIFIHDPADASILFVNRRMREMYRVGERPLSSLSMDDISEGKPPYSLNEARGWIAKALDGQPQQFEWHARTLEGELFWVEVGMRRASLDGRYDRLLAVVRDISDRKAAQARLEFFAHHDPLTHLPNRLLLRDRVALAIARAERSGGRLALLFCDLDQFKTINDSLGHLAGDELLKEVALRLAACVRETDTISRHGGDEFIVLLTGLDGVAAVTAVIARIHDSLAQPFLIDGHELSVSLSTGVALYPEDGCDFPTLLKQADTAMYSAKESGRNTHSFFAEAMNAQVLSRLSLRNGMRRALERGEFVLHYQPQVTVGDGTLIGAEALIRWVHPERGLIAPGDFIPVAEDCGLIVAIGEWVLREACRQAAAWQRAGRPLVVAVNLSALQFRRSDLERTVLSALADSGLPPQFLELELTESILIHDLEPVMSTVRRLSGLGVQLSIDDFGTGYSCLAYLKRLAVDKLKIDRSFIGDLHENQESAAITRAVIQMAHSLGLTTVAEGVEDGRTLDYLRAQGCDYVQGFLTGRPMPADRFLACVLGHAPLGHAPLGHAPLGQDS